MPGPPPFPQHVKTLPTCSPARPAARRSSAACRASSSVTTATTAACPSWQRTSTRPPRWALMTSTSSTQLWAIT
eukprot:359171-Chlamydomonas_euryale.AAC.1